MHQDWSGKALTHPLYMAWSFYMYTITGITTTATWMNDETMVLMHIRGGNL